MSDDHPRLIYFGPLPAAELRGSIGAFNEHTSRATRALLMVDDAMQRGTMSGTNRPKSPARVKGPSGDFDAMYDPTIRYHG